MVRGISTSFRTPPFAQDGEDTMRINNMVINIVEWILVGIMGLCGTLAFTRANAYDPVRQAVISHYPQIVPYLPLIIWGVMFLFGLQSIAFRNKGGGGFTWLVILFSLPSLLSFNAFDLLKIFGLQLKITSGITFYEALGLGVLIMTCYLLLSHMSVLRQARRSLIKRRASPDDIENINTRSHYFLFMATVAALVTIAIIGLLSMGIESFTSPYLTYVPWNVISIGLGCIFILVIYLYWMGSRRNTDI